MNNAGSNYVPSQIYNLYKQNATLNKNPSTGDLTRMDGIYSNLREQPKHLLPGYSPPS